MLSGAIGELSLLGALFVCVCLQMDELSRAEEALTEANHLDTRNPDVWAYLSLVCLKVDNSTLTSTL